MTAPNNPARGERCHNAKLNDDLIQWILDGREKRNALLAEANRYTAKAMAAEIGVHKRTVEKVLEGSTWAHTGVIA